MKITHLEKVHWSWFSNFVSTSKVLWVMSVKYNMRASEGSLSTYQLLNIVEARGVKRGK